MKFVPFAIRFTDQREAELVAEALTNLRCETAADQLKVKHMRDLINAELGGEGPR